MLNEIQELYETNKNKARLSFNFKLQGNLIHINGDENNGFNVIINDEIFKTFTNFNDVLNFIKG